jgi:choline dehydrogenase-like flavoprotein
MENADFVIVGSSGGGGTISWLLAKAGFNVVVLEQGADLAKPLEETLANPLDPEDKSEIDEKSFKYNPYPHDEYRFRLERPDPKRRLRGEYNTFRGSTAVDAAPFANAWTASVLGGGSIIWGTWSYRALPIDFKLRTHFTATDQLKKLEQEWGYSIPDWPISFAEMEPFYNVAETLLAVSGDRDAVTEAVKKSAWYQEFSKLDYFTEAGNWNPDFPFPCPPYPKTPVGDFFWQGADAAHYHPVPLPSGMVSPLPNGAKAKDLGYSTKDKIAEALEYANPGGSFWKQSAEDIWSDRVRSACNMCGYCGEYLCWGREGPKSGSRFSTLKELADLPNAEIHTNAKAYEVIYDAQKRRATGVRYLDVSDPDNPRPCVQRGKYVIVSCGAVQSARLLLMSGPPAGLGNSNDQLGRYAMFHLFGLGITATLPPKFQGILHGEFGHTGNTTSFEPYFVQDDVTTSDTAGKWWKAGTMTSTAKKNPLENADGKLRGKSIIQRKLLGAMEDYNRSLEVRLTADDLPRAGNRVDLDPQYVDEYGFPVARITRSFGENEKLIFKLVRKRLLKLCDLYVKQGILRGADVPNPDITFSEAIIDLIGDHQMGTCRMGDDPATSVVDRNCRLHDVPNVFVIDTSFFPTGFGLNPMVTVVANALRVGTWIVEQSKRGSELD